MEGKLQTLNGVYSTYNKFKNAQALLVKDTIKQFSSSVNSTIETRRALEMSYLSLSSPITTLRSLPWIHNNDNTLDRELSQTDLHNVSMESLAATVERRTKAISDAFTSLVDKFGEIATDYEQLIIAAQFMSKKQEQTLLLDSTVQVVLDGKDKTEATGTLDPAGFPVPGPSAIGKEEAKDIDAQYE